MTLRKGMPIGKICCGYLVQGADWSDVRPLDDHWMQLLQLVSRARCSAQRCTAEPGPMEADGPRISTASLRASRCVLQCIRGTSQNTFHATPKFGYTSRREKPASRTTGSAKVSATASHWSGLAAPRRRMSSFFSSRRRVLLS
jgi:hypothetical protein